MIVLVKRKLKKAIPILGVAFFVLTYVYMHKTRSFNRIVCRSNWDKCTDVNHAPNDIPRDPRASFTKKGVTVIGDRTVWGVPVSKSPKNHRSVTSITTNLVNSSTDSYLTYTPGNTHNTINGYHFTLSNSDHCHNNPFLVILVKCRPMELFDRQQIRLTWGGRRTIDGKLTTAIFLLGMSETPEENRLIRAESELYGDIVQQNFTDSYRNLTFKTIMGFKWVTLFCGNASYVVSVDSDVMLNTHNLVRRLKGKPRHGFAEGDLRVGDKPVRSRGQFDTWYTPEELYPEPTYPPYFPGSCYVMSVDVASAVFRESVHVRFLPWDDVFVGLVMKHAGIKPVMGEGYAQYVLLRDDRAIQAALSSGIAVITRHQTDGVNTKLVGLWNSTVSKTGSSYSNRAVNLHLYNFTICNAARCDRRIAQNSNRPFLVILVKGVSEELFNRKLIRLTWGGRRVIDGKLTTTIFLLGMSENPEVNRRIRAESELYGDIVQENFIDSYRNRTIKTIMGFKWVTLFYRDASYVVSVDSDVMLNTYNLVRRLKGKPRHGFAEGDLRVGDKPVRSRGQFDMWYTPEELYPDPTYPPYFSGSCYVMSVDVASVIFRESVHVRFLPWEDVFVGLVMKHAGIKPVMGKGYAKYVHTGDDKAFQTSLATGIAVITKHRTEYVSRRLAQLWFLTVKGVTVARHHGLLRS